MYQQECTVMLYSCRKFWSRCDEVQQVWTCSKHERTGEILQSREEISGRPSRTPLWSKCLWKSKNSGGEIIDFIFISSLKITDT